MTAGKPLDDGEAQAPWICRDWQLCKCAVADHCQQHESVEGSLERHFRRPHEVSPAKGRISIERKTHDLAVGTFVHLKSFAEERGIEFRGFIVLSTSRWKWTGRESYRFSWRH